MRRVLNFVLSPFGLEVRKKQKGVHNRYFGINDIDKILEEYFPYDGGYFVELGANNGVDQSNTLYFERSRGWRGVLVEPVVHNYFMCRKNRSSENSIHCNACVSFEYEGRFVPISYANLMTMSIIENSIIPDVNGYMDISKRFLKEHEDVVIFGAEAKTLNDILLESDAPKVIDLLSLDVEGAELEVLRGIDFREFRFKYMCIECSDLDVIQSYLDDVGYEMIRKISVHDYLFKYKNFDYL